MAGVSAYRNAEASNLSRSVSFCSPPPVLGLIARSLAPADADAAELVRFIAEAIGVSTWSGPLDGVRSERAA